MSTQRIEGKAYKDKINVVLIETKDRKRTQSQLFTIEKEYWSTSKKRVLPRHKDNVRLNLLIEDSLYKSKFTPIEQKDDLTIHQALMNYHHYLKTIGKDGEAIKYFSLINSFENLKIESITPLELETIYKIMCKTIKPGTAAIKMKKLRTALKYAKKQGRNVPEPLFYTTFKSHKSEREKLTKEEFQALVDFDTDNKSLILARDVFLFQVYNRGLRIGDALTVKYSNDEYLIMIDNKTEKSNRQKILPQTLEIINRYKGVSNFGYVFPCIKSEYEKNHYWKKANIEVWTTIINRSLKLIALHCGIKKNISTHVARHTFAFFADQSGLPLSTIQKMLNHSSLSETEKYIQYLRKNDELDDAMNLVFK